MSGNLTNFTYESLSNIEKYLHNLSYVAFNHKYGYLVSEGSFILVAITIIVIGSFASLNSPFLEKSKDYAKYHRKLLQSGKIVDIEAKDDQDKSVLHPNEGLATALDTPYAIALPFIAAGVLLSLNYFIKNLDGATITEFFNKYTLFMFATGLIKIVKFFLVSIVEALNLHKDSVATIFPKFRISFAVDDDEDFIYESDIATNPLFEDVDKKRPYFKQLKEQFKYHKDKKSLIFQFPSALKITKQFLNFYISSFDIISTLISIPIIFFYVRFQTKHWVISNIIAFTLSVSAIFTLRYNSFRTGFIVLAGLFFYDIYFVFGSDVMLNVATKIDAPMMIKIPSGHNFQNFSPTQAIPLGMLGLGDIVIPGSFIALCLRYDIFAYYKCHGDQTYKLWRPVKKTYFFAGLVSYILGLVLTFVGLSLMNTAQPALLYLSPSLIAGTLLTAWFNGEIKGLYNYEEVDSNLLEKDDGEDRSYEKFDIIDADYDEDEDGDYELDSDECDEDDDDYDDLDGYDLFKDVEHVKLDLEVDL